MGGSLLRLQELFLQGKGWREITRETGFSRNTIRKYLRDGYLPQPTKRLNHASKLAPYFTVIDDYMKSGLFNCNVIFERLRERGYRGNPDRD